MGRCPVYVVDIAADGAVAYTGEKNVAVTGNQFATAHPSDLKALWRGLDRLRFFERERSGDIPAQPACTKTGGTTTCTFTAGTGCSDTPHTIITVWRGDQHHEIEWTHCTDNSDLAELEELIHRAANAFHWVGP